MNKHNTEYLRELLEKIERLESEGRAVAEALQFVRRVKDDEVSSLFQALTRERARYAELLEKIERLEAENRDMREVLEFYANGGNFNRDIWYDKELGFFTGRRAREVLAKWGEK